MRLPNQARGVSVRGWNSRRVGGIRPSLGWMSLTEYRNRQTSAVREARCKQGEQLCTVDGQQEIQGDIYPYECCPAGKVCGTTVEGDFPTCVSAK